MTASRSLARFGPRPGGRGGAESPGGGSLAVRPVTRRRRAVGGLRRRGGLGAVGVTVPFTQTVSGEIYVTVQEPEGPGEATLATIADSH